jgi:hypothetical protein
VFILRVLSGLTYCDVQLYGGGNKLEQPSPVKNPRTNAYVGSPDLSAQMATAPSTSSSACQIGWGSSPDPIQLTS